MIKVKKQKHNTIHYSCSCGAHGMCSFKPMDRDTAVVIDLKCPACHEIEMVTILQYSNEENKKKLLENLDNIDLSWAPSVNEEVLNNGDE